MREESYLYPMTPYTIPAQTRIGHVHLKVSDLQRSLDFYCGLLGFELITTYGTQAAFLSAGGYHHHIGLNTWYSKDAPPVFFGHYWLDDSYPVVQAENVICLDYSIAKGGSLVAYRWNGEEQINNRHFVSVKYKE